MNKIYAMTRDQLEDSDLYSPVFTMTKSYVGMKDSYENNIYFKLFQNSGDAILIERKYYVSINNNNVYFYNMDFAAIDKELKCVYIDNGETITVYAKGDRAGTSICLEVITCPILGKITFHNKKKWEDLSKQAIVEATEIQQIYHFTPKEWNDIFYVNSTNINKYKEYTITPQEVRIYTTLTINSNNFTGEAKIFKLPDAKHVPIWAFSSEEIEYIKFHQDYAYTDKNSNNRIFGKCSILLYKDGTIKVAGLPDLSTSSNISTIDLYLDFNYKRY